MKAVVIKNQQETPNVKIMRIKPESSYSFKPGQFINISHKIKKEGKEIEVKRPYSIASSPTNKEYLELAFDIKENGMVSPYLYNLKKDDEIEISQPLGFFTFEDDIKEGIVLIGAGTGITPLMGILRHVTEKSLKNNITLIYSCKTKKDVIYHKELKRIEKLNNRFRHHITLTQDNEWGGLNGHIDLAMIKEVIKELDNKLFFLCGPPRMVLDLSKILQDAGVKKSSIKIEGYD